jgi:GAF domain-containing protein
MRVRRRDWLWALLLRHGMGPSIHVAQVSAALIEVAAVDGIAVTLASDGLTRAVIHADDLGAQIEELTLTLGEGPSLDAVADARPVLVDDLRAAEFGVRWPGFTPSVTALGVAAVMSLPLRIGAIRLGVVTLHRREPGPLTVTQLANALILTDLICVLLTNPQRGLLDLDRFVEPIGFMNHPEVHQATGMIIAQLDVDAETAFLRLRARAYATNRRLSDVARDVVERRLRFDPDGDDEKDHA